MRQSTTDTTNDWEAFAREFGARWAAPTPEKLCELLQPDVRLIQPAAPIIVGRENARKMFAALFAWLPDMHAEVDRSGGGGDVVFIEFRLIATLGGKQVEWPVVDRFVLRHNLAAERASFFDPSTLLAAVLRHPTTWPGFLRLRRASGR